MADDRRRSRGGDAPMGIDRVPPHNLDAEQSLLGAMFLSAEAAGTGIESVKAEDFYRQAHSRIFTAVEHLFARGEPIDVVTVADRLEANGELEQVGGKTYLLEVLNTVPVAANVAKYAAIVKRTALLRHLIEAASAIATIAYEGPDDVTEVIDDAERRIFEVTNQRVSSNFKPISLLLEENWKSIEELSERQEHVTGVPTGFVDLDKLLAGLHRGDLIILAARPSVGKTAFALNMAVNAAMKAAKEGEERTTVAVFSLEMSSEQLVQRLLSSEARVDSQAMRTGRFAESDWPKMFDAMGRLGKCDLHVDDTAAMSIMEVRAKARRLFHGKKAGLLIIDYLQLMQPQRSRTENRQVEIAEISRGLKILAKELAIPIVALSQLSRAVEQRADKRPLLSDLRESGAIEQDADVVMFIHRDTYHRSDDFADDDAKMPPKGEAEIIVAKHRNGPTGSCNLIFLDQFTRFIDVTRNI
jgi:replicative DNA helicase